MHIKQRLNLNKPRTLTIAALLIAGAAAVSGCGPTPYAATSTVEAQTAPGSFVIPPKVDILLVEDDTGSMDEAYPQISQQILGTATTPGLLDMLDNQNWDYHFATIPLTTYNSNPVTQIAASKYDSNWRSSWQQPFPGAVPNAPGMVPSNLFRFPNLNSYTGFLSLSNINTSLGGLEAGLDNITNSLYQLKSQASTNDFIRDDAMLVVLMVGNGNDTSRVNYCKRQTDGLTVPCEQVSGTVDCGADMSLWGAPGATCRSAQRSLNYYAQAIQALKSNPAALKFYAAVSASNTYPNSCQGGYAYQGSRYQAVASMLGGASFDICSSSSALGQAISSIGSNLQSVRIAMHTRYLPISQDADVGSIVVTRADGVVIPQDSNNGWTYAGWVDGYAIDYPIPMDHFDSFAVELHGSSKLVGNMSANVDYKTKGLQNSH